MILTMSLATVLFFVQWAGTVLKEMHPILHQALENVQLVAIILRVVLFHKRVVFPVLLDLHVKKGLLRALLFALNITTVLLEV